MYELSEMVGLSRERIRQILESYGLTAEDGGHHLKQAMVSHARAQERQQRRDERFQKVYGCNEMTANAINGNAPLCDRSKPCWVYRQIRNNARKRGIDFTLSLPEWWDYWQASGKWDQHGPGGSYGMTRINCRRGYVPGNVRICTGGEAASAYHRQTPGADAHSLRR